ncbi:hypothetical protein [Shewanella surugensis]|uniref:Uncharacterized protein n=1 Tax=Shewanella surugensis TaxID=212020 RepID=A0ABT0LDY6_9GAMM|nr:hypothetical protein [Shewanella surugensis]MCL1125361.1 hypothetical protein [Shewanella surugensis]
MEELGFISGLSFFQWCLRAKNISVQGSSLEGRTYLNHHLPSTLPVYMDLINADIIAE